MSARYSPGALARALDGIVLTDEQAAVVGAPLASRLVVAGAGSGKTFVMALRVAYLVANQQVPSGSILGLTFTRKAAGELNQRIRSMLAKLRARLGVGGDDALAPSVATYDAYASQLVRSYGLRVGADPDAQILSQAQRWQLASQVVEGWAGVDGLDVSADQLVGLLLVLADQCADNEVSPRLLAGYLARVVDRLGRVGPGVNPETGRLKRALPDGLKAAMAALDKRRAAAALISQYRQAKAEAGLMDFSDQAAWARRLTRDGASAPAVMAERARFEAVVLDEFQDTSSSQIEFLAALFGSTPVMAVGDPNQSIYGWRGASADALSAFLDRFQPLAEDRRPPSSAAARPPSPATGRGPERERILHLSVARRNSQAILAVANQLAKPLRLRSQVRAPELRPLPEAGLGHVEAAYLANQADEAAAVAAYLAKHWAPTLDQASPLTAAVLVRARRQLDPMIEALEAAGLDFQVIGRGGLLRTPEVQDIVAALAASQDLTRGDAFIRLATSPRFAVGIKDLDALARLARPARAGELGGQPPWLDGSDRGTRAGDGDGDRGGGIGGEPGRPPEPPPDGAERLAALDALETVMKPVKADEATGISPDGLARLRRIGRVLRRLRLAASYLSLPELVLEAERALGLDLDLLSGPSGREQVNQLVNEAHAYARGQDQVGVASFLAWLEAEGEQFDGLDLAEAPTAGRAVQLLTVHSAKGLEWDVVCVPGLVDASFPAVTMAETDHGREPLAVAWLSDANRAGSSGGLPWPLRLDKEALESFDHPAFDPSGLSGADCDGPGAVGPSENSPDAAREGADEGVDLGDVVALGESFNDFKRRAGAYFEREERRVAYVAATRAKSHLLLTGSWYAAGRASGRPPSIFLEELAEAGLISRDHWVADPGLNESEAGPAGTWPPEHPAGRREPVLVAAARAVERRAAKLGRLKPAQAAALLEQMDSDLARRAALLIRESAESAAPKTVRLPAQTSATTLVALTGQPAEALRRLRRPSPIAPSRGSAVGEAFHRRAAVELAAQSDGPARQAMLDSAVLADVRADSATEAQLNSLMERFRQSRWMSGGDSLVAVETELEVELLGRAVVARIDAVFRDRAGRTVVVDWKTGRSDHGRAHPAHYEQVRLYQAACAKQDGVSPAQIGGYVHYIMENLSVPVECPPDHLERLSDRLAATSAAET